MKRLFCYLLATLGVLCHLTARNIDTAFMRQLPKVDIHSENFNILVDSLTTNMKTEELFGVMFAAGSQAEQEGDVRLQAIYYDKAAGYAQSNGNMNGMVEALLRSSKANRIRNYAGTSIRQLAAAEQAVADDAALRNRVNEAQIENYEALGDIVNAYNYLQKVTIYRQQLADEEREKAVAEAVTAAEERYAAQQEQENERKNKRERSSAITTATGMTVNSEIFYGGVTGMAILAAAVVVLSVAGSRRRKALLRKLDKLFFAIPQSISDNSTEVQTSIMALVNNKNRGSDEFKATLDKCAHGACTLSAEIAFINTVHAIIVNEGKAEYEECDADKIMKQCRTNLLGLAALRNINIDYKSTGSCMVRCDEHSVKVMMNMAIADAMEDVRTGGKVSLWIETEGASITLAVEDDGDSSLFVLDETKSDDDNHDKWKEMHRTGYMRIAERNGAKFVERRKKSGGHIRGILFNQK